MSKNKWSYSGKITGYQLCCGGYEEWESGNAKIVLECPNSTTYIVFVKLADKIASYGFDTLIQARMFIGRVKTCLSEAENVYREIMGGENE